MANGKTESVEDAIELCLNEIVQAAGTPFDQGVREFLHEKFLTNFTKYHQYWPRFRRTILRSATFVGRFADLFAEYDGCSTIQEIHARKAVRSVKKICTADIEQPGDPKLHWCPDI